MNKAKKVVLQFTQVEATFFEKGTEPVENLPVVFEISMKGNESFRGTINLIRTPVKGIYKADVTLEYREI